MAGGPRRRRTLGRGLGDLVGNDLESLVREATPGPEEAASPSPEPKPEDPAARERSTIADTLPPGQATERTSPQIEALPDAAPGARGMAPAPGAYARPAAGGAAEEHGPARTAPLPAWGPPLHEERAAGHPRVFAVASGKGGTGKSLVAVNLAVSMAERSRICLIDADFGLGNAHILLGVLPRWNVAHLVRGERTLDEILVEGPRGLRLLPGASGVPEMASLDDAALDALASTLGRLLDRFDAAILDCPAGLTRQSLVMLHAADVVIVVTTDDLTSMTDAYALIKTLVTHRPDLAVGVLVNDARSASEGAETYRRISHVARKFLGRELVSLGTIPADAQLERSVMERRPAVVGHPRSAAARAIEELALRLISLQGKGTTTSFPERMHRTLAASAVAPGHGRHGEGLCMS